MLALKKTTEIATTHYFLDNDNDNDNELVFKNVTSFFSEKKSVIVMSYFYKVTSPTLIIPAMLLKIKRSWRKIILYLYYSCSKLFKIIELSKLFIIIYEFYYIKELGIVQ